MISMAISFFLLYPTALSILLGFANLEARCEVCNNSTLFENERCRIIDIVSILLHESCLANIHSEPLANRLRLALGCRFVLRQRLASFFMLRFSVQLLNRSVLTKELRTRRNEKHVVLIDRSCIISR